MPDLDLERADPRELASELELDEVLKALQGRVPTERMAEVLDFVHRQRTLDALAGKPDAEELTELVGYLDRLLVPERAEPLEKLSKPYATRWGALADLLDDRLERLGLRADPELATFVERDHVRAALQALEEAERKGKGLTQTELVERLKLRKANLSRLLARMAARDLVVRRRKGRKKEVALGEAARPFLSPPEVAPALPDPEPRGTMLLVKSPLKAVS